MESKAHRNERLRKMRQKYHLGEYKNTRSNSIKHREVKQMARKRARRHTSRSMLSSGIVGKFAGVAGYILFEGLIEPKINAAVGNPMIVNIVELAAGAYLARKGGVIGEIGKAAVYINAYQITQPYLASIQLPF